MQWLNEPPEWQAEGDRITVRTASKTDFWRKTHYGFIRDNGHFYFQTVHGNFTAEVKFTGQYAALYDQAGLMVRRDETTWVKTGIEYVDGVQHVSAVVTHDFSDWSVVRLAPNPPALWLRLDRDHEALEIKYSLDGAQYHLLRLAYIGDQPDILVGVMACSPDGDGFETVFEGLRIRSH